MSRSSLHGLRALSILLLLSACNNKLEVLEPRPGDEVPTSDAGLDAERPRSDGSDQRRDAELADAQLAPDARAADDGSTPTQSERVVSAFAQTCAVRDGALYCWGDDSRGQAAVPGDAGVLTPMRVAQGEFIDVCTGELHSCALRADGAALCWGDNSHGQLGVGDLLVHPTPVEVGSLRFVAIACGGDNTCALTPRGALYCWGESLEGRLGQSDPPSDMTGTLPDSPTPLAVRADLRFDAISLGQGHACAIDSQSALYCWGRNTEGQLGLRGTTEQQRAPAQVEPGSSYGAVAAGQRHSCAIDLTGKLFCWGANGAGLLGLSSDQPVVRTPTQVGDGPDYMAVSASWFHSCALKKSGTLQCWGRNEEGQLGLGDMTQRNLPTRTGPESAWRSVSVGQFHTCAFGRENLWCWGINDVGQLGLGDVARRYVPITVQFP